MRQLCDLSAVELARAYRRRDLSPVEVVEAVLERADAMNPSINAFVTLLPEAARADAQAAERDLTRRPPNELPCLHGIPLSVKDLTDTAGVRTTYGSVRFRDHVPTADALAWARLKAAGGILVGKTATPEFGMLGVTESKLTGITRNPWNLERTAGGSSGGAAAAVAAGIGPVGWGSDGSGSIRVPAACCGVVGLKPSIGRVPMYGGALSYETVAVSGPLARTVADAALLLDVTSGPDDHAPIALEAPREDYQAVVADPTVRGLRIAHSVDLGYGLVEAEVRDCFMAAIEHFHTRLDATVTAVDVRLPDPIDYFRAYHSVPFVARTQDPELAARGWTIEDAHPTLRKFYGYAQGVSAVEHWRTSRLTRAQLDAAIAEVFEDHDLLLTPTMPVSAFPHPGDVGGADSIDGVAVRGPEIDFHRLTAPFSDSGRPAITVPCGFTSDGLPVGLQIAGPHRADAAVLVAAAAYEQCTAWTERRPPYGSTDGS